MGRVEVDQPDKPPLISLWIDFNTFMLSNLGGNTFDDVLHKWPLSLTLFFIRVNQLFFPGSV